MLIIGPHPFRIMSPLGRPWPPFGAGRAEV
jgi:hypothetical protein